MSYLLITTDILPLQTSINSLADDTCYHLEIQRAIERPQAGEARVIPILLRPVGWQSALDRQLDVLPKNHQPVTTQSMKSLCWLKFWILEDSCLKKLLRHFWPHKSPFITISSSLMRQIP